MDRDNARELTALITGASGGIGYELAKLFAQDRVGLVLVARNGSKLATIAPELRALGAPRVEVIVADLASADAIPPLLQELSTRRLEIDILVNNAGYGQSGSFATTDEATALGMIQLNIGALTALTKGILPGMLGRGQGRILHYGTVGQVMLGVYVSLMLGMISTWFMFVVKPQHVERVFRLARWIVPVASVAVMAVACFL